MQPVELRVQQVPLLVQQAAFPVQRGVPLAQQAAFPAQQAVCFWTKLSLVLNKKSGQGRSGSGE